MYAINLFKLWLLWFSDTEAFLEGTNLIGEQAKARKLWRLVNLEEFAGVDGLDALFIG